MLGNYLATAFRQMQRHRLYTLINIAGLAVALAAAILIALFVNDELSYDRWILGGADLYRAEVTLTFPGQAPLDGATTPFALGPAMAAQLPEVTAETHIVPQASTVTVDNRAFSEKVMAVDPNFLKVIRLPLVAGDPAAALAQPDSVLITQATARRYFGGAAALGRIIAVDKHAMTVRGVLRDLPQNTQLDGEIFIPNTSRADQLAPESRTNWFDFEGWTFVRLAPGADPDRVVAKTRQIFIGQVDASAAAGFKVSPDQLVHARLVPFRKVHLTADGHGGMKPGGSQATVFGFAAIGGMILAIAAFNFVNLATAQATMRAKEVSIRKLVGAHRPQLILQFLGESTLTAIIALALALGLVALALPTYAGILDRHATLADLAAWPLAAGIPAATIAVGLLGGLYPAFVLSRFRPAASGRSGLSGRAGAGRLRTVLVVGQFAISIGLGVAAFVIFAQVRYARDLDLGFNRDNIVAIGMAPDMTPSRTEAFLHTLAGNPAISGAAQSNTVPFDGNVRRTNAAIAGNPQTFNLRPINISPEFPAVYSMRLLGGRLLTHDRAGDVSAAQSHRHDIDEGANVLIDALAARTFGYAPSDAVGKTLVIGSKTTTIVGVVQTALFESARSAPAPSVYYFNPNTADRLSVRLKGGRIPEGVAFIDATWRQFEPGVAMRRHFLDDMFDKLLAADERQGRIFGVFVAVAVAIASLGLFGLAAFTAARRTKEMAMRKVLGARTPDLLRLLLWQFSIPVVIGAAIGCPVAWIYLRHWLGTYAYRIDLNPLYFVATAAAALLIAWTTIITHAMRLARESPMQALRYE